MSRWARWFWILVVLCLVSFGAGLTLTLTGLTAWGTLVALIGNVSIVVWMVVGMYQMWSDRRTKWVSTIVSTLIVADVVGLLMLAKHYPLAFSITGIWAMLLAFLIGVRLLRMSLVSGRPVIAIARITIDEAMRMKVASIFLGLLVIMLPVMPLLLADQKIEYRMQSYLTWSLTIAATFLSFMTIFMACGVITQDIKHKQIFMTAVKPVTRFEYLMGRWIGISLLNLLLLLIAGFGVYSFALVVEAGPAQSRVDRIRMQNEIMVARMGVVPVPESKEELTKQFDAQLARLREQNPGGWGKEGEKLSAEQEALVHQEVVNRWYKIEPLTSKTYVFEGLEDAAKYGRYVVLRYKPNQLKSAPDGMVKLVFNINGEFWPMRPVRTQNGSMMALPVQQKVPDKKVATLDIPVRLIKDGKLTVRVANMHVNDLFAGKNPRRFTWPYSVSFTPGKDMELLYRVDTFTNNFLRSLMVLWAKLIFLSMLGLMAGTFLGFHIAALLSVMIFCVAEGTSFINESLDQYQQLEVIGEPFWDKITISIETFVDRIQRGMYFSAFRIVIRIIGHVFIFFIPSFSEYQPIGQMARGRLVPWSMVGNAFLYVGFVWTSTCTLLAWLIFRKRELAKITV